jgi:hypothetical protein
VSAPTTASVTLFLDPPGGLPNPGTTFPASTYYVFTPAASVNVTGTTTGSFTLPTGYTPPSGVNPYIEVFDTSNPTSGWFFKAAGPGTGIGAITFTTTQPIILTGGVSYGVAIYPSL